MTEPLKLIGDNFLTEDARTSPVWREVQDHLQRMLAKKRIENDNSKLTDVETATLRGHIQLLKAFVSLGAKPPAMTAPSGSAQPRPDYGKIYG